MILKMQEREDLDLLNQYRSAGEREQGEIFRIIVSKYRSRVYLHIRRMVIDHADADDLVQNTFIKVWKNLPEFREESQLYTWIYRIATNECLAFLKQKRRRLFLPLQDVEFSLAEKLEQQSSINVKKLELELQKAILKLPEKQRLVFNLRYYDEMKYEEMSEVLGTSVGALKASYHHAVNKIEKYLTSL